MAADFEESAYPSENCGEDFESKTKLDEHMKDAHGITLENRTQKKDNENRGR